MFRIEPFRRILISASPTLMVITGCVGMTQTSMLLPQVDDPVRLSPNLQPLRDPAAIQEPEETRTRIYGYGPPLNDGPEQVIPQREPRIGAIPNEEAPRDEPANRLAPQIETPVEESPIGPQLGPVEPATADPLVLTVDVDQRAQVGNGATFKLVVRNPNDHTIDNIVVEAEFDDALVFPGHKEKKIRRTLGSLAAGMTHEFAVMLSCETAGKHCARFSLTADSTPATRKEACVEYVANELEISILGPEKRSIGSRAEFTIKLANRAERELTGLSLAVTHDPALDPREGSAGAKFEKQRMSWHLDSLQPGEFLQLQVEFECLAAVANTCVIVDVISNELPSERKAACLEIDKVEGPLQVDLIDTHDPVTVEESTEHLLTIHNRSDRAVDAIAIVARIPVQLDTHTASAQIDGQEIDVKADIDIDRIVVRDIGKLAAGSTLTIRIESNTLKIGDAKLAARVMFGEGDDVIVVSEPMTVNAKLTSPD